MYTVLECGIKVFYFELSKYTVFQKKLEMWANAQPDGRPAEYRSRPLLNAAVWLTPTTRVPCSNAAKMRNALKLDGVPQTTETISAASRPKFTILWGHLDSPGALALYLKQINNKLKISGNFLDIVPNNILKVPRNPPGGF